ncbi:MAG: hypothetical protein JWP09_668 [Candidatus Taylorbacteria bacterium]|nr:hypothetical protein [Candidatus Taylorbacteria bacterium]
MNIHELTAALLIQVTIQPSTMIEIGYFGVTLTGTPVAVGTGDPYRTWASTSLQATSDYYKKMLARHLGQLAVFKEPVTTKIMVNGQLYCHEWMFV